MKKIKFVILKTMKKNNLVILIASSLFCAFGLKTTRASLCVASLRLLLKAFWLKTLFAFSSRQNPLQSLSNPDGTLNGKYWQEITLPGVHSDIGGGYANGYQNRDQNMAFYSMQTMVNAASEYGIKFNEKLRKNSLSYKLNDNFVFKTIEENYYLFYNLLPKLDITILSNNKTTKELFFIIKSLSFIIKNKLSKYNLIGRV